MTEDRLIGLGCMRLSTEPDRDEERATETLHAALDAGVNLLDSANVYCRDHRDVGHNERLIAAALASWSGDASRVQVVTKGGLTRPGGLWVPDGRAKALRAACDASREALGVERIDLYLLHAPDPKTPWVTSVRALARLRRDGLVREVGLSNVNVSQIEEARRIVEIAAVQVELSVVADLALRNGVAEYCREHGILLLAHAPLGGPRKISRLGRLPWLHQIASRHEGSTPHEIALAWIRDLGGIPIPGATQPETARSAARGQRLALTGEDRALLDERLIAGRRFRVPRAQRRPPADAPAGVVLIMGYPAAGKTTAVASWVERGYQRLNRDQLGGTLAKLAKTLKTRLEAGDRRFVLDNTYPSRAARGAIIEYAWDHGLNVRCVWLKTSLEDAQINAVHRMLAKHGRLLEPGEINKAGRADPGIFQPQAQFSYRSSFEPPAADEGFAEIEELPFKRRRDPVRKHRALILEVDGVLRCSRSGERSPTSPDDVEVLPGRAEVLRRYAGDGWLLLGIAWQPSVEEGTMTTEDVDACFDATREQLGVDLDVAYCPHRAGPPRCWCRRPLPGLGVLLITRHRLDPSRCLFVSTGSTDRTFARRLGFTYAEPDDVFVPAPKHGGLI